MRYIIGILSVVILAVVLGCVGIKRESVSGEYLRVHIRANSNSQEDQEIKYMVRDAVVEGLIPALSNIESKEEAVKFMGENLEYIERIANEVLQREGFTYTASAKINNEYFPTRTYEGVTLEDGYYDALILSLGDGVGDNWWCVVYPAFCFLQTRNLSNYGYISKIWEIINNVNK